MQARADYIDYNTSNLCDEYGDSFQMAKFALNKLIEEQEG